MTERNDNTTPTAGSDHPAADHADPLELDSRARRALRADFQRAVGPTCLPKRLPPQDRPQRRWREWAVAAGVLMAIGLGVLVRHLHQQGSRTPRAGDEPAIGAVGPAEEPVLFYDQVAPAPDSHDHLHRQVYQQRYFGVRDEQTGEVFLIREDTVQTQRDSLAMDM